jgi:hypothetical protein
MSELIVLFEDSAHESLARQILTRCYGFTPAKVRYIRCTDCTGVERALPGEVQRLRTRNYQKGRALLIIIDADEYGVEGRKRRLDKILKDAGQNPRDTGERIAYVVPRLEAENWYLHFCCPGRRPIDEGNDYKRDPDWRRLNDDLGVAARDVARAWHAREEHEPPSVQDARLELARIAGPV